MKVLLFGATGMVGQGVLRECLRAPDVTQVVCVGRSATGQTDPKGVDLVHKDVSDLTAIEPQVTGFDACFFCLGVSSVGMSEADYTRITYDLTMGAATTLARLNPQMTFIYVSGVGTDSTEQGRSMWARVKGKTENALLALPFKAAFMFRPGAIQPLEGIKSKTAFYQGVITATGPLLGLLHKLAPNTVTTTEVVGRAMLHAARSGAPKRVLEPEDFTRLG
jgi:uncharacterized protein YbjT (DUF2867 family)